MKIMRRQKGNMTFLAFFAGVTAAVAIGCLASAATMMGK